MDQNTRKLNWKCYENIFESEEDLKELKKERDQLVTKYDSNHSIEYEKPKFICYTIIQVLKELWETPLNNAAINFLECLRPSSIRVIRDGTITCDCKIWRVTIYVKNNIIKKIEQEVNVGMNGFRHGEDASNYLNKNYNELEIKQTSIGVINTKAIQKLRLKSE